MSLLTRLFQRGPTEDRAGYTDAVFEALLANVSGGTADSSATAAAEMAVGLLTRLFTGATVGPAAFREAITPELLGSIARGLGSIGNAVYLVDATDGLLRFTPAMDFDVAGRSLDPGRWSYRLKLATPSEPNGIERTASASRVLHVRVNESSSRPWAGRSPLALAGLTAATLANIERSLSHDTQTPVAHIIPTPDGATKESRGRGLPATSATRGAG